MNIDDLLGDPFIPGKVPLSEEQKAEILNAVRMGDNERLRELGIELAAIADEVAALVQRLSKSDGGSLSPLKFDQQG
jgi:hypothetical protein